MRIITIIICLLLVGCATTTTYYEWDTEKRQFDPIWKVKSRGAVKTEVKPDGSVMQNSKGEPLFKVDVPLNKIGG